MERHSFRRVWGDSPETLRKLCISTNVPHQKIRWNYGTLRIVTYIVFHKSCFHSIFIWTRTTHHLFGMFEIFRGNLKKGILFYYKIPSATSSFTQVFCRIVQRYILEFFAAIVNGCIEYVRLGSKYVSVVVLQKYLLVCLTIFLHPIFFTWLPH